MMKSLCNITGLAVASLFGAGCATLAPDGGYYGNPLQAGAQIEVTRELQVPAGYARVYLQHGSTLSYASVDQYAPFCYFLVNEPLPVAQTIRPGVFQVGKVSLNETEVRRDLRVRLASRGVFANDGGPALIAFESYMKLTARQQRHVRALVCSGAFDSPPLARPIRLPELQHALGDSVKVRSVAAPGYGQ